MSKMEEPEKYTLKNGKTKWRFRAYVGINPKTGKQSYTNRQGFNTKTAANKELRRIKHVVDNGEYFKNVQKKKDYTYQEVYEMWLAEYKNTVAASTLLKVKRDFENRLLPVIGKYRIDKIDHTDIQKLANEWGEYQKNRKWISTLGRVFKYAQKHNIIMNNPVDLITIPKYKKTKNKKLFYELDELNSFLAALNKSDNLQQIVFLRVLIFTGIRRGEALALYWECVNFEKND